VLQFDLFSEIIVFLTLGAEKENLDRSDASINLGFESPTVKFVSEVVKTSAAGM
jgi:hypothetical protein